MKRISSQLESLRELLDQAFLEMMIEQQLPGWTLVELYSIKGEMNMANLGTKRKEDVDRVRELRQRHQILKKITNSKEKVRNATHKPISAPPTLEKKESKYFMSFAKHWGDNCIKYDRYEKRIQQIQEYQFWFKSLKEGHTSRMRCIKPQCFHCKKVRNI
uniref:SAM domain-containing protein n=1 Tax=Gongylonema pulchrum TaxID=637853 RepID=A0A183CWQ1_9BILA